MTSTNKPGALTGAFTSLLLTAPLMAIFFLGYRLASLPLVPLDFFDFLVPYIPGWLVTFVIDAIVDTIIALGLGAQVGNLAKLVEKFIAYAQILLLGAVIGAVYFAAARRTAQTDQREIAAGASLGAVLGVLFAIVSLTRPFPPFPLAVGGAWVIALFAAWGAAMGWLHRDLSAAPVPTDADLPPAHVEQIGRREFLVRVGGATATLTLVGTGLGLLLNNGDASAPDAAPTAAATDAAGGGSAALPEMPIPQGGADMPPAPGMRPEYTPVADHYRIDIATRPIGIDLAAWALPFSGLVGEERAFTMEELRAMPAREEIITMQCISNRIAGTLISTTKWTGVPVRDVLALLDIQPEGRWLRVRGGDDFFEYVSIEMCMNDERIMFAYDFDDAPLPERNGFPLRIYIPERYGMKQPKWITNIEITAEDEGGYWVRRGWSEDAIMNTTSVIDTVATDALYRAPDGIVRVPVGGYAMASTRGISKVEVSINEGEWQEASLRDPLSDKTWVFWRYDWEFEPGNYTIAVRSYERDGTPQPEETQGVRPDGATGIHRANASLSSPDTA